MKERFHNAEMTVPAKASLDTPHERVPREEVLHIPVDKHASEYCAYVKDVSSMASDKKQQKEEAHEHGPECDCIEKIVEEDIEANEKNGEYEIFEQEAKKNPHFKGFIKGLKFLWIEMQKIGIAAREAVVLDPDVIRATLVLASTALFLVTVIPLGGVVVGGALTFVSPELGAWYLFGGGEWIVRGVSLGLALFTAACYKRFLFKKITSYVTLAMNGIQSGMAKIKNFFNKEKQTEKKED